MELILASRSPRRAHLLRMLGLAFQVEEPAVDETPRAGEESAEQVERLARAKARDVARRAGRSWVVGGDTVVALEGRVLGKPSSQEEALEMLLRLQGRSHRVFSGVALATPAGELHSAVEEVSVRFRPFSREAAEAYVATGEPMDKAGAYGIQGLGAALVDSVNGDFYAVMGLPVARLLDLFRAEGGLEYRFGVWVRRDHPESPGVVSEASG